MLLNELELVLRGWILEQAREFAQAPDTMREGQLAGGFQVGGGLFGGHLQKALQHPDALQAAVFHHGFGPVAGVRANQPGTVQQPLGPVFHCGALAAVDMLWRGAEASRRLARVERNLFHAGVENPHHAQLPARPHFPADIFRRHGVIRLRHFHMAIPMHRALGFAKNREEGRWQRVQRGLLAGFENLRHLLARGAVDAGVGHPAFPFQ